MNKTAAEIARMKNVSRPAMSKYISKHKIQPSGKKGKLPTYNVTEEPLASYLAAAKGLKPINTEPADTPDISAPLPSPKDLAAVRSVYKPLNDLLAGRTPEGHKPSSVFYAKAMKIAEVNQDAGLLLKLAIVADKENREEEYQQQRLKTELANEQIAQGKADRINLENAIRHEQFIDRATVKLIFGKTYALHTSILTPLSLKLSSMIAAIPSGNKKEETIKKLIDDEIYAALESIKNLLIDFITE